MAGVFCGSEVEGSELNVECASKKIFAARDKFGRWHLKGRKVPPRKNFLCVSPRPLRLCVCLKHAGSETGVPKLRLNSRPRQAILTVRYER